MQLLCVASQLAVGDTNSDGLKSTHPNSTLEGQHGFVCASALLQAA